MTHHTSLPSGLFSVPRHSAKTRTHTVSRCFWSCLWVTGLKHAGCLMCEIVLLLWWTLSILCVLILSLFFTEYKHDHTRPITGRPRSWAATTPLLMATELLASTPRDSAPSTSITVGKLHLSSQGLDFSYIIYFGLRGNFEFNSAIYVRVFMT